MESIPGLTRRTFVCPTCKAPYEVCVPLSAEVAHLHCPKDNALLRRYFGSSDALPTINYGYRESRYATEADANIAKYQFTNL